MRSASSPDKSLQPVRGSEREFYNQEYNTRLSVPDTEKILARWFVRAEQVRKRAANRAIDLPYGSHPGERLDLFRAARSDSPLLVFSHGGYWRSLDKSHFSWIAPPYVDAGISVALLNYGLVPEISIEAQVRQHLRALTWLWDEADKLGFAREKIVVAGHSAGGHLAAMMLAAIWPVWRRDLPVDLVKAGVAVSGLFDLNPVRLAHDYLNRDLGLTPARVAALSPSRMRPRHRRPLITAVGSQESSEFHRQSRLIRRARPKSDTRHFVLRGRHHLSACDALAQADQCIVICD